MVRQLVIILLILSQGIIQWQGSFAYAKMASAVDTENYQYIQDYILQSERQNLNCNCNCNFCNQNNCLITTCDCHSCVHCSIGLISSVPSFHFSPLVLKSTLFVSILDGHSAQPFKPPRQFYR